MTKKDALIRVKSMLSKSMDEHGEAIVVTANAAGLPHASWMGTLSSPNIGKLLTMTSPDSRKVLNILENPRVEWIFTSSNKDEVVYLRGNAQVVHEPSEVESAWKKLKDKTRAYFMQFLTNPGITFFIIETNVDEIEFAVPKENAYKIIRPPFLA